MGVLYDHLLGEVEVFCREGVVDFGHGGDVAFVEVEAGAVGVLGCFGVLEDGDGVVGVVAVVVEEDDVGVESGLGEGWA